MKTRRISHRVYGVWEYDRELDDLNRLSAEGWQLEKGGCFHSVFVRDEKVRYLYQMDYAPNLEDRERYLSFFMEQGWEYVNSTFNGWYYFRKPYQENLPVEETEIYTDRESLLKMQGRYLRCMLFLAALYTIMFIVNLVEMIPDCGIDIMLLTGGTLFVSVVMWLIVCNIRRKQKEKKELVHIRLSFLILAALSFPILSFLL